MNRGIASALNAGVRIARDQEFEWIFTFDQDSSIAANFVESMLRTVISDERKENIAVVTPQCLDSTFYFPMKLPISAAGEILETITSGSMIPSSIFAKVGEFDETLFMDYVDIEFCLRCRRAGFRIVQSSESVLYHSLGKMTPYHVGSLTCYISNHSARRRYYMTRNRVYLLMKYLTDWQWVLHQLRLTAAETVKLLLWEKKRLPKLMRVAQGIFDGIFGRMGKRVEL